MHCLILPFRLKYPGQERPGDCESNMSSSCQQVLTFLFPLFSSSLPYFSLASAFFLPSFIFSERFPSRGTFLRVSSPISWLIPLLSDSAESDGSAVSRGNPVASLLSPGASEETTQKCPKHHLYVGFSFLPEPHWSQPSWCILFDN